MNLQLKVWKIENADKDIRDFGISDNYSLSFTSDMAKIHNIDFNFFTINTSKTLRYLSNKINLRSIIHSTVFHILSAGIFGQEL